jgi:hypothetical protein
VACLSNEGSIFLDMDDLDEVLACQAQGANN